jgi:polyhydroxybutyrate depolymerase
MIVASKLGGIVLVALLLFLVVLCGVVAGVYWATGPAVRCERPSQALADLGWSARTVDSGGVERCYYLYVPPGYEASEPAPLVLSYHGFLSNPESHALITGWHQLAERDGFVLVYPQGMGYPQRWNAGATWGDEGVDDVQFFRDMVEDVSAMLAIDQARIYVNGFSNGGGMSVRIGCEAADLVTAIGSVGGAVVGMDDCEPSRPVPAMAFHGTADPIVYYEGGDMRGMMLSQAAEVTNAPTYFLGVEDWVHLWAEGNGCASEPVALPAQGDVRGIEYVDCDQDAAVILYTIEGGGHQWPGGWPIPLIGHTSTDIDATEELWSFFQEYRLEE